MSQNLKVGRKRINFPKVVGSLSHPTVSVILASYNSYDVIETALKSVFEQTYQNKEVIVIDGASTDGTVDVLEKYDNLIDFWVSEKDSGVYEAFNKAANFAHGDWLYFLGSDDHFFDSRVLERVFRRQLKGKLIYGNVVLSGNGPIGSDGSVYDGRFSRLRLCYQNICQQAIFYHKSLFDILGGFSLRYPILADREFNIRIFADYHSQTIYIDEVIAVYNTEGMSSCLSGDNLEKELPKIIFQEFGAKYFLRLMLGKIIRYLRKSYKNLFFEH